MKRIETFSDEVKAAYLKTIELAKIYGECRFACGRLDCEFCPFYDNCTVEHTEKEWFEWAEEEVKDETDI